MCTAGWLGCRGVVAGDLLAPICPIAGGLSGLRGLPLFCPMGASSEWCRAVRVRPAGSFQLGRKFSSISEEILLWEGALLLWPGSSGNLRRWSFLYHQVCPGDVGVALSGSAGTLRPHSLGLAKVHGKLRGLGVPLGCGIPTQTLNSGAIQQASGVPSGHLEGPAPVSHTSDVRRPGRQAGWLRLGLWGQTLPPEPPGARCFTSPHPSSLLEVKFD